MNKIYFCMKKHLPRAAEVFLLLFFTLFFFGCVTPPIGSASPDLIPEKDSAYIYGRFTKLLSVEGYTVAVVVKNIGTGKRYAFALSERKDEEVQAVALPAGEYRIDTLEYMALKKKPVFVLNFEVPPEQYKRQFGVQAGTAVYIGDFSGTVTINTDTKQAHWSLTFPENRYTETTLEAQKRYPFLANAVFISNM